MNPEHEIEILLVEDNPYDANKLVHVKDGVEALDYIFGTGAYAGRDTSQHPKVVLLDLKLPKVDGLEVLRAIKTNRNTRTIPVVIMTSSKEQRDVMESYLLGVNSYVVKPVEFENFSKAVSDLGSYWVLLNQTPDAPVPLTR